MSDFDRRYDGKIVEKFNGYCKKIEDTRYVRTFIRKKKKRKKKSYPTWEESHLAMRKVQR